jgi:hypothetical protein
LYRPRRKDSASGLARTSRSQYVLAPQNLVIHLSSSYRDAFIYEYIGDVISHPSFMKRMRDYATQGIKHFYFMMLQRDEYIDATKRGGIARFANHSCAPNCYVAKWTVGDKVRMGIFASRRIAKDEELTFNYNVDRYGLVCFIVSVKIWRLINILTDTTHNHAIVANPIVLASWVARRRRTSAEWTLSTWTVSSSTSLSIV